MISKLYPDPMAKILSKSGFTSFLQCRKRLWLYKFNPKVATPVSEKTQSIFDQGDEVEIYAQKLFAGAVAMDADKDIFEAEKETSALMEKKTKIIFQPTAIAAWPGGKSKSLAGQKGPSGKAERVADKIMSRADIIKYNAKAKAWDIYEVKSSTEVKSEYIPDITFQKITFESAGYKINKTYLVFVNNEYVRSGPIEPEKFIKIEDVSAQVKEATPDVKSAIPEAFKLLREKDEPKVRIVKQCRDPYECPFINYCWTQAKIPEYSIYNLTGVNKKKLTQLLEMGIMEIKDIPDDFPLSDSQQWQVTVEKTRKASVAAEEFVGDLKSLKYPLYFLDYETLNPAVPKWDGASPYKHVPFQYSLHVARKPADLDLPESEMEHHEFLPAEKGHPVPALLKQLKEDIGDGGTIIVWSHFEKTQNKKMAESFPRYKPFLESVNARIFDLMGPFQKRHIVDPGFRGSYSIKYVLPVLGGGISYEDIEVDDGSDVGREWYNSVYGGLPAAEVKRIRKKLLAYCGRDTYAMVRVLKTVLGMAG